MEVIEDIQQKSNLLLLEKNFKANKFMFPNFNFVTKLSTYFIIMNGI